MRLGLARQAFSQNPTLPGLIPRGLRFLKNRYLALIRTVILAALIPGADTQKNASWLLGNLVQEEAHRDAVVRAGGVDALQVVMGLSRSRRRNLSLSPSLSTESGVATTTDPLPPPPSLSLSNELDLKAFGISCLVWL